MRSLGGADERAAAAAASRPRTGHAGLFDECAAANRGVTGVLPALRRCVRRRRRCTPPWREGPAAPPGGVRVCRAPVIRNNIGPSLSHTYLVGRSERRAAAPLGRRWHGSTGESDPGRASSWIRCGSNNRQRKKPSHGSTGAAIPGRAVPEDWRGDKPSSIVASPPSPPSIALALASSVAKGEPALAVGHRLLWLAVCGPRRPAFVRAPLQAGQVEEITVKRCILICQIRSDSVRLGLLRSDN